MRALALQDVQSYGALLAEDSADGRRERALLAVAFTTGESYFFRDASQCDLLASTLLPQRIALRASNNVHRLRIWSAGCASGEEAYTLAMLVDQLSSQLARSEVLILGTDINADAIAAARAGRFGAWSLRALDAARKQRYFRFDGGQWQIDARLRQMVTFRTSDLLRGDHLDDVDAIGMHDFDLIVCRNVFIYLDPDAIGHIVASFAAALADGGYLVTGHSELFGQDTAPLSVRLFAQSAAFQKTAPAATGGLGAALAATVPSTGAAAAVPATDGDSLMQSAWRHADRGLLDCAQQECERAIAQAAIDTQPDPQPYYLLAQLAQQRGDRALARALLKKTIYADPSFIAAYLELAALYAQDGDRARARRMHETARTGLKKLPPQALVPPYRESSAADIAAHVERLLAADDERWHQGR